MTCLRVEFSCHFNKASAVKVKRDFFRHSDVSAVWMTAHWEPNDQKYSRLKHCRFYLQPVKTSVHHFLFMGK
ncbi:hypothetical protein scyTo_0000285 [Scyliorhinus torazame]|uniref:Uncharacterized protein n=1 Tax=Scyliorhinus torazame TaxID=75743 RepID=A0A401NUF8_SCYTO|nr:hypothetical protein [Scyliorhinus torazame]